MIINKRKNKFLIVNKILWLFLLSISIYLFYLLFANNFLKINYIRIAMFLLFINIFLTFLMNIFRKYKIFNIIILIISINIVLFSTINLNKFLISINKINEESKYSENVISIVVLNDSNIKKLEDIKNKKLAYSDINNISDEFFESINNILFNKINSNSYLNAYNMLLNKDVDALIINQSFYKLIEDIYPNFLDNIRIIYDYKLKDKSSYKEEQNNNEKHSFNIYVSGIDTYGSVSNISRSDVNIIITFNQKTNKVLLTTTPRDAYVNLVGYGDNAFDKLTHSGVLGIDTSINTLEKLYDIDIDYYIKVNFTSFINIIDLFGGIEIENPFEFTTIYGETFPKGKIKLDSATALRFVRERKSLQNGDVDRGKNQERVISEIIKKLSSKEVLYNYSNIMNGILSSIQTDIPVEKMVEIISNQLNNGYDIKVESQRVDGVGRNDLKSYLMPGNQLYMFEINKDSLYEVIKKIEYIENEE